MQTDELIYVLSDGLTPAPRAIVARRLGLGLTFGLAATFLVLLFMLPLRPDLGFAITGAAFWIKFSYTFVLAVLGLWLVERQSRASANVVTPGWLLLAPIVTLAVVATLQISAPQADVRALALGHTARLCSLMILALSLPIFVGVFWAMRCLSPTRLTLAGACGGLLAGAASATLYGLHCPEFAAPFILIWYSLGILLATGLGAIIGRWALRW